MKVSYLEVLVLLTYLKEEFVVRESHKAFTAWSCKG